jgi:transposase InsO family protein
LRSPVPPEPRPADQRLIFQLSGVAASPRAPTPLVRPVGRKNSIHRPFLLAGPVKDSRQVPRYLIRDWDSRYGEAFDRRLRGLGVRQLRTPLKAPRANALAERWVRSARTECLDHLVIVDERHLQRVLDEYVAYFNAWRPHQGLGQRPPCGSAPPAPVQPDRPDHRAAGARGSASCLSACSVMVGWSSCALQA